MSSQAAVAIEGRVELAHRHADEVALAVAELRRRRVPLENVVVLIGPLLDPLVRSVAALVHASRGEEVQDELARRCRVVEPLFLEPFTVDHAVVVLGLFGGELERQLREAAPSGTVRCLSFDQHGNDLCHLAVPTLVILASA